MLPSIFGENLFDDSLSDFFDFGRLMPQVSSELYGKHARNLMKTDVRELDGSYELDVDLPGFKKDEVTVDLQDGYLTISAAKGLDKDESGLRDVRGSPSDAPRPAGGAEGASKAHHHRDRVTRSNAQAPRPKRPGRCSYYAERSALEYRADFFLPV